MQEIMQHKTFKHVECQGNKYSGEGVWEASHSVMLSSMELNTMRII